MAGGRDVKRAKGRRTKVQHLPPDQMLSKWQLKEKFASALKANNDAAAALAAVGIDAQGMSEKVVAKLRGNVTPWRLTKATLAVVDGNQKDYRHKGLKDGGLTPNERKVLGSIGGSAPPTLPSNQEPLPAKQPNEVDKLISDNTVAFEASKRSYQAAGVRISNAYRLCTTSPNVSGCGEFMKAHEQIFHERGFRGDFVAETENLLNQNFSNAKEEAKEFLTKNPHTQDQVIQRASAVRLSSKGLYDHYDGYAKRMNEAVDKNGLGNAVDSKK